MESNLIFGFDVVAQATLDAAGGKGANLSRLACAGFAVPRGFIIATDAYRAYVTANDLQPAIDAALKRVTADDAGSLERASDEIRAAFSAGKVPRELASALRSEYADYSGSPVAVRSSATTEDLPEFSFAGQQDTYLNVTGDEHLLTAVVDCWSSLWTARAIGYRLRNGISHADMALAVVVQEMVPSDVSGVLFTANPLTGHLGETVIDAAFGLGEALVAGRVEPDHIVVDSGSGQITLQTIGAKRIATRARPGGGVEDIPELSPARPALTDEQVKRLVEVGRRIQREYGAPQDIEWALADGRLHILQSRPITSLFPVPKVSFDPLLVWLAFGSVQGLMGPMTPLGRDIARHIIVGAGSLFGMAVRIEDVDLFVEAGERVWVKISDFVRNPVGARLYAGLFGYVEPSVGRILQTLDADPRLGKGAGRLRFRTARRLARFFLPIVLAALRTAREPEQARARFESAIEARISAMRVAPGADRFERLANAVSFLLSEDGVIYALPFALPRFLPIFAPSMAALRLLTRLSEDEALALEVTRSLPGNVTTQMDLALWRTSRAIVADDGSASLFRELDASALAARYLSGALPAAAQTAVAQFMDRYGMRGVGEIDFGQPRWRENPAPVMHTLQSYLQIDPAAAPDTQFARGEQAARDAIEKLAAKARAERGGRLKEKAVRSAARRVRALMGARESPKFFAIRAMGKAREALLEAGREFTAAGTIDRPDDLCFLKLAELQALSRTEARDWKSLIAGRRAAYERELRRRQVPRVLASDGRAFYEGVGGGTDSSSVITGSPVSPGVVEGIVHVVLDPRETRLAPGEILVCPGTDPAWTPLFMAAGGLVTEVGGMMTHGSVVAREYGIPAVVGVDRATERLATGQRIRLDGTTGRITLM